MRRANSFTLVDSIAAQFRLCKAAGDNSTDSHGAPLPRTATLVSSGVKPWDSVVFVEFSAPSTAAPTPRAEAQKKDNDAALRRPKSSKDVGSGKRSVS